MTYYFQTDPTAGKSKKELKAAIQRVYDLHKPMDGYTAGQLVECQECGDPYDNAVWWPCPTIRALDGEQI